MLAKITAVLVGLALAAVTLPAQTSEAVELMLIRENSVSTDRDQKLFALELLGNAVARGSISGDMYTALERLVFSGSHNRAMASGRVVNNFPEVRFEAVRHLGAVGSAEARSILLRAGFAETEPLVVQEIFNALGSMAMDDNAHTVATIVRVAGRFHRAAFPSNHVALGAVNALGQISDRDGGITDGHALRYLFEVARGPYAPQVRERAQEVIDSMLP